MKIEKGISLTYSFHFFLTYRQRDHFFFWKMTSNIPPQFRNINAITDNEDLDEKVPSLPKKTLVAAFDLIHPTLEEELLRATEEKEKTQKAIKKVEEERFGMYKYVFYGVSIATLMFFSLKNWFPLIKNPFF